MPISNEEKRECLRRELRMRERNYPRWVATNKLRPEQARHEIAVMRAILHDYDEPELFNQGRNGNGKS